jgi:phospholipid/cholesterol/gamma-HCH transport system substrate-binding protein
MPDNFKSRRLNEITGAFVLAVVAALIAAVVWTSHSQRWFKSRVTLRIALPEAGAAGIREGSEVYFLGTLVGSVSDMVVEPTGRMAAEAGIRRDFFRFVRVDSSAVVKRKFGVAGDSFFEIIRGDGRPLPEKGASIACTDQFQSALELAIEEIHQEALRVLKQTSAGLDTWTKLGADLGESRRRLDQLADRLDKMAAGVEAGKGAAGRLLTDAALADDAQNLLARANVTLSEFQNVATNLNLAVDNIRTGTARLPEIADAAASEAKELPGLVLQTRRSMIELERLMEALQREWLIRSYVNHTNPAPILPASEPAAPAPQPLNHFRSPKGFAN